LLLGVQGVFQHVKGVQKAVSGYAGGAANTAQYERVSEGDTGHAESVQVTFDPTQVSYGSLLQIYFSVAHNPTELNRQGPDSGTQYRSALFPVNADQQRWPRPTSPNSTRRMPTTNRSLRNWKPTTVSTRRRTTTRTS
jgi:methionine-S-sulfoxide reductase